MDQACWHVYLLLCADGSCYCGIAKNLERRLAQHNGQLAGGAIYTRTRRPVSLLGFLDCADRSAALKLEYAVKQMPRHKKLALFGKNEKQCLPLK